MISVTQMIEDLVGACMKGDTHAVRAALLEGIDPGFALPKSDAAELGGIDLIK